MIDHTREVLTVQSEAAIGIGRSLAASPSHTTGHTGHVSGGSLKRRLSHAALAGASSGTRLSIEDFAVTCPLVPNASRLISGFCSSPCDFALGQCVEELLHGVLASGSRVGAF